MDINDYPTLTTEQKAEIKIIVGKMLEAFPGHSLAACHLSSLEACEYVVREMATLIVKHPELAGENISGFFESFITGFTNAMKEVEKEFLKLEAEKKSNELKNKLTTH